MRNAERSVSWISITISISVSMKMRVQEQSPYLENVLCATKWGL